LWLGGGWAGQASVCVGMPPRTHLERADSVHACDAPPHPPHPLFRRQNWVEVSRLAASVPRPAGVTLSYGTAGFRAKAAVLPSTFLRMGFLAALRAQQTKQVRGTQPL
jgi:hypothetical protein